MALITALPNFFGTTAPASADFNQAARAIVAQLGGTCPGGSNQFLFSEQVDNSAWTKSHLSVSADSVVSPTATLTADLVVEDAVASVQHFFTPATSPVILPGTIVTQSIYAKIAPGTARFLFMQSRTYNSSFPQAGFNLATGAIVSSSSIISASSQSVGNGWFRCWITFNVSSGSTALAQWFFTSTDGTNAGATYTGDGVSGLYVWGAQLTIGSEPGPYTQTTSAAVAEGLYTSQIGNLDSTNISPTASFRNAQKAEPYSTFVMSAFAGTTVFSLNPFPDTIILGPTECTCQAIGMSLMAGRNAAFSVAGGSIDIFLNNTFLQTIQFSTARGSPVTGEASYTPLSQYMNIGDYLYIDFFNLNPFGSGGGSAWAVPNAILYASVLFKTMHVR